ncbi:MAG: hypothetical protein B6241_09375 [Spirochaetaceae bacterium 4572_59]|nr:MAG: hypothetical protein B6241_09375 [Spirochaetaceae bacterium 4572_59]
MGDLKTESTNSIILLYCRNREFRKELEKILANFTIYSVSEIWEVYRILDDNCPALILTDSQDIKTSEKKKAIPVLFICHAHELAPLILPPYIKDVLTFPFVAAVVQRRIKNYLNLCFVDPVDRKRYKLLFDLIPAFVFVRNREGRFLAVNNSFAKALNLKKEKVQGSLYLHLQLGRKDLEAMLEEDQKVFHSANPLSISQERFRDGAGNICWLQTTRILCPHEAFEEDAIIAVAVDITKMKDTEIRLEHKLDTIGKIAGEIAHDYNNILTGILSASELLQKTVQNNNQALEYSNIINESAQRAADLNKKLLIKSSPELAQEAALAPVSGTILLVDDEPILRKMLTELLEKEGYTVIATGNGKNGLFQFKRHPGLFDLIIMDMVMPEMTGPDSYDAIKSINPDIKVLFISGYFKVQNLKEITESDKTCFIHKPFKEIQMLEKVRKMLQ